MSYDIFVNKKSISKRLSCQSILRGLSQKGRLWLNAWASP